MIEDYRSQHGSPIEEQADLMLKQSTGTSPETMDEDVEFERITFELPVEQRTNLIVAVRNFAMQNNVYVQEVQISPDPLIEGLSEVSKAPDTEFAEAKSNTAFLT